MPNYNQAQFPRHLEILVTNGQLAEVQAIIGPIGYDAAALEAGQALLQSWLMGLKCYWQHKCRPPRTVKLLARRLRLN